MYAATTASTASSAEPPKKLMLSSPSKLVLSTSCPLALLVNADWMVQNALPAPKQEARHSRVGLLAQITPADAQFALCRLSGSTALIRVISMPLPMTKVTPDRVENAESNRNPDNGEPQSQQLPRQPQDRIHASDLQMQVHASSPSRHFQATG